MPRMHKKIEIYNLGYNFVFEIYKITKDFPEIENNNLSSQMRRAAVSIPTNIAEGSTRHSEKAFLSFLTYAYGSAKELEVLLSLSKDSEYIKEKEYRAVYLKLDEIMAKLFKFMNNIEKRTPYGFFRKYDQEKKFDI
ncbi:MAG TPA: four helix bundle protein [Candidatus Nanoarchaeia archaeon]|nr:four helix bundle protein [Candidatus Nanoarchaeia archaeon]